MRPLLLSLILAASLVCGLSKTVSAQQPSGSPRATAIKEDLRQILAGPAFARAPQEEGILQRAGRFLREKWNAFWDWVESFFRFGGAASPGTAQVIMWVVLTLLLVGIAFVLAYAFRRFGWGGGRRRRAEARPLVTSEDAAEEQLSDPDRLLAAARELAAAGQYRRAYRAVFLALLLRLDRAGLIRFDRASTNGEYLRALRARPDVLTSMRPLANDFDHRWYGGKPVDEPDFLRMLGAYEKLNP